MSIEKERLLLVQAQVTASDLRPSHKDDINDMLMLTARATNGVQDKTQALTEAVAAMGICFARDSVYRREDLRELIKEALNQHTMNCPLANDEPALAGVRRGRDGRDGRDSTATITGKGWKLVTAAGAVTCTSICGTICFVVFVVAKGAKWI